MSAVSEVVAAFTGYGRHAIPVVVITKHCRKNNRRDVMAFVVVNSRQRRAVGCNTIVIYHFH